MERIVIVAYKPIPGKEQELEALTRRHWDILHREGLVSTRQPVMAKAQDGTLIEVFGWKSEEAVRAAHDNAAVQQLWAEYEQVCTYMPVGEVPECGALFSEFAPL